MVHDTTQPDDHSMLLKVVWDAASTTWLIKTREVERYLDSTSDRAISFTPDKAKARRFASESQASVAMRDLLNAVGR